MSRQFPPIQRPRVPPIPDNPYQGTTSSTLPLTHCYTNKQYPKETNYHLKCTGSIRGAPCPLEQDACFSDEAFTENSYYEFYDHDHGYQTSPNKLKESRTEFTEFTYSDDSGSTRLPYFEYDEISNRRHSRNNFSERSLQRIVPQHAAVTKNLILAAKDGRRVFPNDVGASERFCPENVQRCINEPPTTNLPRRIPLSRVSDRVQSSLSSDVPSAVVYGCGGKCQTFENVCYYFLQVAFTMGILIGISLGIAGWVLRKSAARNMQVLLYIGALLALVCALLLGIQCNARYTARLRQKALRSAKRAPIPMEVLQPRMVGVAQQRQPLMENGTQRGVPAMFVQTTGGAGPVLQVQRSYDHVVEQQGVPWWRRKDLH